MASVHPRTFATEPKLLLTHKYGADGFLDALRHATDMERGVIRSLRAGLLTFEKHGAIATY